MAKVQGPLFSLEARGKVGNALVMFPWKGRNVCRAYTIPANPQAEAQKLIRQKLASLGKNVKVIKGIQTGLASGSAMYQLVKAKTPATQIWNAYFVKSALDDLKTDSNFVALSSAIMGSADVAANFSANAAALAMVALTGAAYATEISPEMQLAMGAYAAYKLALSGTTSKYDTYPSNWTTAQISDFATDYFTDT